MSDVSPFGTFPSLYSPEDETHLWEGLDYRSQQRLLGSPFSPNTMDPPINVSVVSCDGGLTHP